MLNTHIFSVFFSHRSRYSNSEAATLEANLSSVQCVIVRIVVVVVAIQTSTPYLCGPRQTDRRTDADGRGRTRKDGQIDHWLAGRDIVDKNHQKPMLSAAMPEEILRAQPRV